MFIDLTRSVSNPAHKSHTLLPRPVGRIRGKETRSNGGKFYNFKCRTERLRQSPTVYAIDKYNATLDGFQRRPYLFIFQIQILSLTIHTLFYFKVG